MRIFNSPIIRVLTVRPFLYLWSGQVLSQLAINMANFILLLRIAELTHSNTATALFVLSIGIPALLFGSLAGVYVDHWSKKWVLIICNFLRAILILVFFVSSETLWAIYLFSFLTSTVTQFFVPAEAPTIPLLVKGELLLAANGLFTLTFYASVIVGYMLAGPALTVFGASNVFLLISVLFILAGIFVGLLPNEKRQPFQMPAIFSWQFHKTHVKMIFRDFKEGYLYLIGSRVIITAFILLTASQVLISSIASLAPGFAREVMHVSLSNVSVVIIGPAALGMILGSVLISGIGNGFKREKLVNFGIWSAGFFLILLSFSSNFLFFSMLLLFLLGISNALITVIANTTLQEKVNDQVRGRIYGFLTAFGGFFSIFPVLLAGVLSDFFGVATVIFIMGLGILGFSALRFARKVA